MILRNCLNNIHFEEFLSMEINELKKKSCEIRKSALKMIRHAGSGHPGGSMSVVDILTALYYRQLKNIDPADPHRLDRDRVVLSKGHANPALYAVLADKGYFPAEELDTLRQYGSRLQGHPDRSKTPGVDACGGSLGQGPSVAVGLALGAKAAGLDSHIYVIVGDGELEEGQPWEAAMSAVQYKLDNLTWIIDNNGLQIMGTNDDVMGTGSLEEKFCAFGFEVYSVNGHDYSEILPALEDKVSGKPKCIVAHTVKGKGVSFMENEVKWHGAGLSDEQLEQAIAELDREEAAL